MFPDTREGTVYATLYYECYNKRPRGLVWDTVEEFLSDLEALTELAAQEGESFEELDTLSEDVLSVELGYKPSKFNKWEWE